ncbi:MAG: FtsK/SpoIIIE domain-containing protein [bacterium]
MANIYTAAQDEQTITDVIRFGFNVEISPAKWPKYISLRLALAHSLGIDAYPDESFDRFDRSGGSEYDLRQVTGLGKTEDHIGVQDFDDAICGLLSVYHEEDLFSNPKLYRTLLQRHIRRGLHEIRTTWQRSHDFSSWLAESLFSGVLKQAEDDEAPTIADDDRTTVMNALTEVGIRAEIKRVIDGSRIDRYELLLPEIHSFELLRRSQDKLGFLLGLDNEGVFINSTKEPKVVALDIPRPRKRWKTVPANRLREWSQNTHKGTLPVWLGENVLGEDFSFDLAEAPHLLVAGTTGSGKSITLHALILSLILTCSPDDVQFAFIDPKVVELGQYQGIPHQYGDSIAHLVTDAMELLNELVAEMEWRNQQLSELGASNIEDARQHHQMTFPRIVVVVEELADLMMQSKDIETPLVRLAQKARSTGIHLVLATQRPDASTFSGLLRSNIPGRIALRVQKSSESKIILDEVGAEKLLGAGDMLVKVGSRPVTRVHGAYITADDIKQLAHKV